MAVVFPTFDTFTETKIQVHCNKGRRKEERHYYTKYASLLYPHLQCKQHECVPLGQHIGHTEGGHRTPADPMALFDDSTE